jgi:hypothetical protein
MDSTDPVAGDAASIDHPGQSKHCRAKDPNGSPCVKNRAHPYSDTGGPRKAHRTAENVVFHGGIKTPARFYMGPSDAGHISEADSQTWMRL